MNPKDAKKVTDIQDAKLLINGRLAILAIAGMYAQEQVNGQGIPTVPGCGYVGQEGGGHHEVFSVPRGCSRKVLQI